jgi:manganese/zinc/iron transport system permease protein
MINFGASFLGLQSFEWWVIGIGILVCAAAGLIGSFLVLRKMALMGDAISHAVLPGIAIAAWWTGRVSSWPVLVGAAIVGILTPFLVDLLRKTGRLHEDASLGLVFTILFSIGVLIIANMGNKVSIDIDCVLFGEIAMTPFDRIVLSSGLDLGPRAFWTMGVVFILNVAFIAIFYKELKISTFDPILAESMGLKPQLLHYMLLGMVSLTTIAAFESVGAIIVVGMLIAPGAAAYLLTDRLSIMLILAIIVGALCSILGYGLALGLGGKVSIAGSMATAAGILFTLAFLFSPSHGVLTRLWNRRKLSQRLEREHILLALYRKHEKDHAALPLPQLAQILKLPIGRLNSYIRALVRKSLVIAQDNALQLTDSGQQEGIRLLRGHRLWETYLEQQLGLPTDHLHQPADDMEHFITPELQEELASALDHPQTDPSGLPIPEPQTHKTPT